MERKNTLIIISLAGILVLAGFSANEKAYAGNGQFAPPFGDFVCWADFGSQVIIPSDIQIIDQFGEVEHSDLWQQIQYCTAASKLIGQELFESPFAFTVPQFAQHYQDWLYLDSFFSEGTGQTVLIEVPQFDDFETVLGDLEQIMVPAVKFLNEFPTTNPENIIQSSDFQQHWNCYNIDGPAPDVPLIDLTTQHGEIVDVFVDQAFLFCTPMIKFDGQQQFGDLLDEHMVCYRIFATDTSTDLPVALSDQLTIAALDDAVPLEIDSLEKICVPAFKSFPVVGGSMVPINTSALLLAGAQSNLMWMIPFVIAGIGISIFVTIRRK